jgi:hypothetical protein
MPYADPARRREYDAARKSGQRAQGWTKKRMDTRLTPAAIEMTKDIRGQFNEVVTEVRTADGSALGLEASSTSSNQISPLLDSPIIVCREHSSWILARCA